MIKVGISEVFWHGLRGWHGYFEIKAFSRPLRSGIYDRGSLCSGIAEGAEREISMWSESLRRRFGPTGSASGIMI